MNNEKPFSFIIDLRECVRHIAAFKRHADIHHLNFCQLFVNELRYEGIINEVMQTACMYPRSKRLSIQVLEELGFAITDSCSFSDGEIGSQKEIDLINDLVLQVGDTIIRKLSECGFYDEYVRYPKISRNNEDYESDEIMQIECDEIRLGLYRVGARSHRWDGYVDTRHEKIY